FYIEVNTATKDDDISNYVPINIEMDRMPKNIMIGSFVGGRSHVKPMLDICAILIERGHNVVLVTQGNNTLSSEYPT
ncbi:2050_t:CDS:2, partial [Funneliformis caledonium]